MPSIPLFSPLGLTIVGIFILTPAAIWTLDLLGLLRHAKRLSAPVGIFDAIRFKVHRLDGRAIMDAHATFRQYREDFDIRRVEALEQQTGSAWNCATALAQARGRGLTIPLAEIVEHCRQGGDPQELVRSHGRS